MNNRVYNISKNIILWQRCLQRLILRCVCDILNAVLSFCKRCEAFCILCMKFLDLGVKF